MTITSIKRFKRKKNDLTHIRTHTHTNNLFLDPVKYFCIFKKQPNYMYVHVQFQTLLK